MRRLIAWIGMVYALGVMAVSATVNARYGMSLAQDNFDKYVLIAVALFADSGKALSWIFLAEAVKRRHVLAGLASLIIFLSCLVWAVSGSLGYVSVNRAQSSARVEDKSGDARSIDEEVKRKEKSLAELNSLEPVAVVRQRLETQKRERFFTLSNNCKEAESEPVRKFCANLARLETDVRKAEAAEVLEADLKILRERRRGLGVVAKVEAGDFQSALIAQLMNLKATTVQLGLSVVFVIVLESSACFLLWLALDYKDAETLDTAHKSLSSGAANTEQITHSSVPVPEPKIERPASGESQTIAKSESHPALPEPAKTIGTFVGFARDCLGLSPTSEANVVSIAVLYKQYCSNKNLAPLPDDLIARNIKEFARVGGLKLVQRDGRTYLLGVVLRLT